MMKLTTTRSIAAFVAGSVAVYYLPDHWQHGSDRNADRYTNDYSKHPRRRNTPVTQGG